MYGIWNGITKRFVFGIKAKTPNEARRQFREKAGKVSYCWRYEVKTIPNGWVNPKNALYEEKGE